MSYPHEYQLGARYFAAFTPTTPGSVAYATACSTMDLVEGDIYRSRSRHTRIVDLGTCNVHRIPVILNRWDLRCAIAPDALAATLAGQGIRRLRRGMVASQLATLKNGMNKAASAEAASVSASQAEAGWTLPPEAETSLELQAVVMLAAAEAHAHRASIVDELPYETDIRVNRRFFTW